MYVRAVAYCIFEIPTLIPVADGYQQSSPRHHGRPAYRPCACGGLMLNSPVDTVDSIGSSLSLSLQDSAIRNPRGQLGCGRRLHRHNV